MGTKGFCKFKTIMQLIIIFTVSLYLMLGCSKNSLPSNPLPPSSAGLDNSIRSEQSNYDQSGVLQSYVIYDYDAVTGKVKKRKVYDSLGNLLQHYVNEMDSMGWTKKTLFYDRFGTLLRYDVNDMNVNGRLTKVTSFSGNGVMTGYNTWEYDSKECMTKYLEFDEYGLLHIYRIFEYNSGGYEVKESQYSGFGSLDSTKVFEYDTVNRISKISMFDNFGTLHFYFTVLYGTSGMIKRIDVFDASGAENNYTILEYDTLFRTLKRYDYGPVGELLDYTQYVYSGNGDVFMENSVYYPDQTGAITIYDKYKTGQSIIVIKIPE